MSSHSITEAKTQLPKLIDRVLKGEKVVITRHGRPVVELKPVSPTPRRITLEDVAWLDVHRVGQKLPKVDAGVVVSRMRDEDWP